MSLADEFAVYVRDIFANAPTDERDRKLATVLSRLADSAVREAASTMLKLDVDAAKWTDHELGWQLLNHVAFRASKINMMPAHCMMLEAGKRLTFQAPPRQPDQQGSGT